MRAILRDVLFRINTRNFCRKNAHERILLLCKMIDEIEERINKEVLNGI